jgi:hypothetical protein
MKRTARGLRNARWMAVALCAAVAAMAASCDKKGGKYNTNLLVNGSFEDVGRDGIPSGWSIENFRGPLDAFAARYGVDKDIVQDGKQSWFFQADPNSKRFFLLSQEVEVGEATHVRIRGWIQVDGVTRNVDQYPVSNFTLTFYDANHNRFQELRLVDRATPIVLDSRLWAEDDYTYRLPRGTHFVKISCGLGMTGQAWFDNVSLEVPEPVEWETATSKNYVFHWMPGHPMPEGSQASQQQIFDTFERRLGIESNVVINYYFYPDTSTIRQMMSLEGYQYTSWDDMEFHSINANDDHEVVHFMTDPIGRPPRAIAEGTAFWLIDDVGGETVDESVTKLVRGNVVPTLQTLLDYNQFMRLDPVLSFPASASFVAFLADRFGTKKLMDLYREANGLNSYETLAAAFEKVYEIPITEVETAWRKRIALRATQG